MKKQVQKLVLAVCFSTIAAVNIQAQMINPPFITEENYFTYPDGYTGLVIPVLESQGADWFNYSGDEATYKEEREDTMVFITEYPAAYYQQIITIPNQPVNEKAEGILMRLRVSCDGGIKHFCSYAHFSMENTWTRFITPYFAEQIPLGEWIILYIPFYNYSYNVGEVNDWNNAELKRIGLYWQQFTGNSNTITVEVADMRLVGEFSDGENAIPAIAIDESTNVEFYNLQGCLVTSGNKQAVLSSAPKGIYILKAGNQVTKFIK